MGWFEKIFNTPSHHRVHHGRNPKYIDKNHAGVFIIWDKMFGTFQKEEERPVYGITTPVATWNPLYANLKHYQDMADQLAKVKSWSHKMGILFKKPGWQPETGSYTAIPEVERATVTKYDVKGTSAINFYVLFQYAFILAGTAAFLFTEGGLTWLDKVGAVILISTGILTCGGLFERRKWVLVLEFIRHPVSTAFVYFLFAGSAYQWHATLLLSAVSIISIGWLFYLKKHFKVNSEVKREPTVAA